MATSGLWKIKAIDTGTSMVDKSIITYMRDFGVKISIPRVIWALEGTTTVIVDTSVPRHGQASEFVGENFERAPDQEPEAALKHAGIDAATVEHVVLTHLHWDHAGNCDLFPRADVWLQASEFRYAMAPSRFFRKAYLAPLSGWEYPPPFLMPSLKLIEGEVELLPGIRLVPVAGHSPGSQAVIVATDAGDFCIAGDAVMSYENLEMDVPSGFHLNVDETLGSMDVLRQRNVRILPSHDYRVFGQNHRVAEFP